MLALSRPKIAVTVSIIVVVHTPRRHRTVWGLHSQNDSAPEQDSESGLVIPGNRAPHAGQALSAAGSKILNK